MSAYQHPLGALWDVILWVLVLGMWGSGGLALFLFGVASIVFSILWLWTRLFG